MQREMNVCCDLISTLLKLTLIPADLPSDKFKIVHFN